MKMQVVVALLAVQIAFGGDLVGAPTSRHVVLTDQLAAYGVLFSTSDGEGVRWWGPEYSWEPARYAIHAGDLGERQGMEPIRIDFECAATFVSIRGFDGGHDEDHAMLTAFDADGEQLAADEHIGDFDVPGHRLEVRAEGIRHVTIEVLSAEPMAHGLFFDELTFDSSCDRPSV